MLCLFIGTFDSVLGCTLGYKPYVTYSKVIGGDLTALIDLGESVNEEHVIPMLDGTSQLAMRKARRDDISKIVDTRDYSAIQAIKGNVKSIYHW
ncbi:MAG: hypothetical protein CENE_00239 [Candidatus Celerinatantimonas neptuna]|nr:MAG: hypothetical protein CENE_00239 [Candidatus Celerinatantimonas neptuna]